MFSTACAPRAENSRTGKAALPVRANLTIGAGYQIAVLKASPGKLVCSIAKQRPERYDAYLAATLPTGRAEVPSFLSGSMPSAGERSEILNKERCRTPE